MKKLLCSFLSACAAIGFAGESFVPPVVPLARLVDLRAGESPLIVKTSSEVVEENAFFQRVKTSFVFINPNPRMMAGEVEFPLPEGAFVCGYRLEIEDMFVPGVVCEKTRARVAFENEVRKRLDPGIVEQVKGNVWKTRIFPLAFAKPRRAEVEYIVERERFEDGADAVYERDGADIFVAEARESSPTLERGTCDFKRGVILWDTSLSRLGKIAADREELSRLPEQGEWELITFAEVPEAPITFTTREELLAAVDKLAYDGGTDLDAALEAAGEREHLLFSDEKLSSIPPRKVSVRKVGKDEKLPRIMPRPSTLLASVWASRRMCDLAAEAKHHKDEFLALGRKYSVAGPGLSLIVLDSLEQYLEYKIEPPQAMSFHDEWVKRRAAEDDEIAAKLAQSGFEASLLRCWQERVNWWLDPKPKRKTPKSGLFEYASPLSVSRSAFAVGNAPAAAHDFGDDDCFEVCEYEMEGEADMEYAVKESASDADGGVSAAKVSLKPWDPETPYLKTLKAAEAAKCYETYLEVRKDYLASPAFYLDCADFFFAAGERRKGIKIASNLTEFKLENPSLWRTLGYRLRQAECYDEAIKVFRHLLELRPEEGISYRDLAIVLEERGKAKRSTEDLNEALKLLHKTAFTNFARRSGSASNDLQVSVFALEELNGLLSWCAANGMEVEVPEFDAAFRRDLPVALRIVLEWDADETDIDLHVLEPNGEEAYYGNRRTLEGGYLSQDVVTGYGPEEYFAKEMQKGVYKVLTHYFASHQSALTGATTVQAVIYTDWGKSTEKRSVLTIRLDHPDKNVLIGEIN